MKCLVTGAEGFVGQYLVELLLRERQSVCALAYVPTAEMDALKSRESLRLVYGNILDRAQLDELIREERPDAVFHLAAQSLPGLSWEKPELTFRVNILGTVGLLESLRSQKLSPVVVMACSSGEYAASADPSPISEDHALGPSTPYAVSKTAQDLIGRLYHEVQGLRVIRVRPFYLIGPRKRGDVSSDFARGIVAVERGTQVRLRVGNLEAVRDLLDVRDGAEALWLLAQKGGPGEVYNICSGRGYRVRDVLEMLKGFAKAPVSEYTDEALLRPLDEAVKIGDPAKLSALGWRPRHDIRETLKEVLAYWREQSA